MVPFSAGFAATSLVSGFTVTRTGVYRGIICAAWAVMVLGWGLMTTLDDHSNTAEKVLYPLIVAAGIGCLFQPQLIALQAAMPLKDMATSTGAFVFIRTMGNTVGISLGQVIYTSMLKRKLNKISGLSEIGASRAVLSEGVRTLQHLPQPERGQIIHAYAQSISTIWVFNTPAVGAGFIMILFIKAYSLKQTTIQGGAHAKPDEEKADSDTTTSVGVNAADEKSEEGLDLSL